MNRATLALTATVAAALIAALMIFARESGPADAGPDVSTAGSSAPIVGEVSDLRGSLKVKAGGKGAARKVKEGTDLHFGDVLVPAAGVHATIKLTVPRAVSSDAELVFVDPADERVYDVKAVRTAPKKTTLTIDG